MTNAIPNIAARDNVVVLPLRPKVLVVDDDAVNRRIWAEVLDGLCTLAFAQDGDEALRIYEHFRPSLVVLDRMMPGLHGDQVMARIRALDPEGATRIVLHSMLESPSEQVEGMQKGADLYIPKSTDIEVAVTHIQSLLRLQKNSQTAALFRVAREHMRQGSYSSRLIAEGIFRHAALLTEDIRAAQVELLGVVNRALAEAGRGEGQAPIRLEVAGDIEQAVVYGDDDLLTHAVLAVARRAVSVSTDANVVRVDVGRDHGWYTIAVADHGPVLAVETWREMFRFHCAGEDVRVALPIARETMQRHFGDLDIARGRDGMVFTFRIPSAKRLQEIVHADQRRPL